MDNKSFLKNKLVVITRPEPDNDFFKKKLELYGAEVYLFPTIKIESNIWDIKFKKILNNISEFDWLVFTSAKGVDFFMEAFKKLKMGRKLLSNKKIAAIGKKTAKTVYSYNLNVNLIPTKYTTDQLAKEMKNIKGLKILLPRANIASKKFVLDLQNKGAHVTDIPIYKTKYIQTPDTKFENLVKIKKINFLTFTSSSTVMGFLERIKDLSRKEIIFNTPVISIGPVTTKTAQKHGFLNVFTADIYTINGMLKKLEKIA